MSKKKWPGEVLTGTEPCFVAKIDGIGDAPLILKVKFGSDPMIQNIVDREKASLEILKGLAVPKRVSIAKEKIIRLVGEKKFSYVAMEFVPGRGCFARSFPPDQALALWVFTIEQLCAFHRRKVLYTDFKHNHLRITDDLTSACLVDFDSCLMVESSGLYPREFLGNTPELAAPEFQFAKVHTERVIVYQMGMFLGSLLIKYFHNSDLHPLSYRRIQKKLKAVNCEGVFRLFERCLSKKPSERPKDLETLFSKLQNLTLPQATYDLWGKLREPYRKELLKLEFKDPQKHLARKSLQGQSSHPTRIQKAA